MSDGRNTADASDYDYGRRTAPEASWPHVSRCQCQHCRAVGNMTTDRPTGPATAAGQALYDAWITHTDDSWTLDDMKSAIFAIEAAAPAADGLGVLARIENLTKPLDIDASGRPNYTSLGPPRVQQIHELVRSLLPEPSREPGEEEAQAVKEGRAAERARILAALPEALRGFRHRDGGYFALDATGDHLADPEEMAAALAAAIERVLDDAPG